MYHAVLNKKYELLLSVIDHLWERRKDFEDADYQDIEFVCPDYLGFKKAGNLESDTIDRINYCYQDLLDSGFYKSKKQFLDDVLHETRFNQFVKKVIKV